MTDLTRIGVDTSKSVFTLHGVDAAGCCVLRRNLRRREFEAFFQKLPPVEVVLEACGGSHHWGRWLMKLGHRVRLIPPQYIKPFVKRGKNDRNDAEAICVAAAQPSIGDVPVKAVETQAGAMLLSTRELLVRQRTQLVNALRGHATELGLVAPQGDKGLTQLQGEIATADDEVVPPAAKEALALLGKQVDRVQARLAEIDAKLKKQLAADPLSQRLAHIPGGDTPCHVRPRRRLAMASRTAQAPPAQACRGRLGQQDGPHRVGHDDERRGISAREGRRLTLVMPPV